MKSLKTILPKKSGRSRGKITVRHQGGRMKRFLREIDFKRDKANVWGKVIAIEYDPNRNVDIALVLYEDGQRRYILGVNNLKVGGKILASSHASIEVGNALPLSAIPVGTQIHNIELKKGKGGQIVKSAGSVAYIFGKEDVAGKDNLILVKMPSGEIRKFKGDLMATIGQVGNVEAKHKKLTKAGTKRRMGIRPTVRGVAMHPNAHPHGGGEGRSSVGMKHPKTPWGKAAVGKTRNKRKYSNRLIVERRRAGKHN